MLLGLHTLTENLLLELLDRMLLEDTDSPVGENYVISHYSPVGRGVPGLVGGYGRSMWDRRRGHLVLLWRSVVCSRRNRDISRRQIIACTSPC